MNEELLNASIANPKNLGEMPDADAVGTVGNPECGDMVRMWLKFTEKDGRKVIDRASFQSFGCQTAIAVASMATEMLKGRTVEEARDLSAAELSAPLGPLPPMKIHCGQMVEGALRAALESDAPASPPPSAAVTSPAPQGNLAESLGEASGVKPGKLKIVPL
ncbi:MAG TPA: iron-sulfur cluster assembly scaffold protein [Verrucomicrobiales bacterium]|jgi:nitrogen fixation NifU-like protein|nr:iron-sulfur cluster assembly scaffold protein [Verrucomicrobiales bacterium]